MNQFFKVLYMAFIPIRRNGLFFTFMYALGIICSYAVVPNRPNAHVYDNLWLELFLDIYIICVVLTMIPSMPRKVIQFILSLLSYIVTITDMFCFIKFQATLNPTMLLLAGETNSREAGEFLSSYLSSDIIFSPIGIVLLLMLSHIIVALIAKKVKVTVLHAECCHLKSLSKMASVAKPVLGIASIALIIWAGISSWHNKYEMADMFSKQSIGEVEHELTTNNCAQFYLPLYRLTFSIFSNNLAAQQIDKLIEAKDKVSVDSCSYMTPTIVLVIGESYNKYHSELYGYDKPTSPRQLWRMKQDRLTVYTDVVAPWNLTSFVFKNMFSTRVVGEKGEWCDYPLFPEVFRKAGYHVAFLTNQFLPQAKEAVYDFSGGFFLNNPVLSKAQFDTRNSNLHAFDEGLLKDFRQTENRMTGHDLIIFHLMGQHVGYNARYPRRMRKFYGEDYDRPDLSVRDRDILSHFDNATLYNDSIVNEITKLFEDKEAVVIYLSDHGEEVFNDGFKHYGRNHSAEITGRLAHQEFDVPFWIWCSRQYTINHPDVYRRIVESRHRRMMTDALPHLLFYLAGISSKDYNSRYCILSDDYDEMRPRIIKGTVDYDKIIEK